MDQTLKWGHCFIKNKIHGFIYSVKVIEKNRKQIFQKKTMKRPFVVIKLKSSSLRLLI